ncbi:MAG TPA: hypothetical protein VHB79_32055 [Polyangiaceae bacterium]|nr:hypothetical protein [Polyangiaceae bacterium]
MHARRSFALALCSLGLGLALGGASSGCGGAPTRLVTVKAGTGEGAIQFEVKNLTDVPINSLYLVPTDKVPQQLDNESTEAQNMWGADLLNAAIPKGERVPVPVAGPGRWDCKAVDRDGRYQHIAGLKLAAGGRYILELNDSGWRVR